MRFISLEVCTCFCCFSTFKLPLFVRFESQYLIVRAVMSVTVPSKMVVIVTSSISLNDRSSKLPKPKYVSSKVLMILYSVNRASWFFLFTLSNCATQSKLHARTEEARRMGGGRQFAAGVYIPAAFSICGFFKHFVFTYQAVSGCVCFVERQLERRIR